MSDIDIDTWKSVSKMSVIKCENATNVLVIVFKKSGNVPKIDWLLL
jgi:hypothetical protein